VPSVQELSSQRQAHDHLVVVESPNAPPFAVPESKVHPPPMRPGLVRRTQLLDRISDTEAQLVTVVAPAGYGKSTLLGQWVDQHDGRVGWLNADAVDNDPTTLTVHLAVALDRASPMDPDEFATLMASAATPQRVAAILSCVERAPAGSALVIDNAETIVNPECRRALDQLAAAYPPGRRLLVASREDPPVPWARLRAAGALCEIGREDLALDVGDATTIFRTTGADPGDDLAKLVELTEGWPAGIYLVALGLNRGAQPPTSGLSRHGTDRFVQDYLRAEILDRSSPEEVAFLTRTSVLDRMCGSLCDFVLDAHHSGQALEALERRNLFVIPLDDRGMWFRYHHLLRDYLLAELERREPDSVPELHSRATTWHEEHELWETAILHARHAGDAGRAASLVLQRIQPVWASGRIDTVLSWLKWFEDEELGGRDGELAVHASLIYAMLGRVSEAERWAAVATRSPDQGVGVDGSSMVGLVAYLRALLGRDGIAQMRADAKTGRNELSLSSPYVATMIYTEGLTYLLEGDATAAETVFATAHEAALAHGALPLIAIVQAERSIAAGETGDWARAGELAHAALAVGNGGPFDDYWTSALVYAREARMQLRAGQRERARELAMRATRLRPLLTAALPVVSLQALIELTRTFLGLQDQHGARSTLIQAEDIVRRRPRLGNLPGRVAKLRSKLSDQTGALSGPSGLTAAELRLLPLLASHLTLGEIAGKLTVSRNTVKSHSISIYRKLGVSTRSASVTRAEELGLLVR
jgi:LuxR family maltose regulon positive regulatory protein